MRNPVALVCLVGALISIGGAASADEVTLGTYAAGEGSGTSTGPVQIGAQAELRLLVPALFNPGDTTTTLFNEPIGPDQVGHTYRVDASSDPAFVNAVSILTNGIDNYLGLQMFYPDGNYGTLDMSESQMGGHPDFRGDTITAITFHLTQYDLSETSTSRGLTYAGDLSVLGTSSSVTPEPASMLLLVTGLGGLWVRRRVAA